MGIYLQMVTKVTEENYEQKMMRLISFDFDWSGRSGLDYVSNKAKELGFTSDAEYTMSLLKEDSLKDKVCKFVNAFSNKNLDYYKEIDAIVSEEDDGTFTVSLSAYTC